MKTREVNALQIRPGDRFHTDQHGTMTVEGHALNKRGRMLYNRLTVVRDRDGARTVQNFPEGMHFDVIEGE